MHPVATRSRHVPVVLCTALSALALASCAEDRGPLTAPATQAPAAPSQRALTVSGVPRPDEDRFIQLAHEIPGFGGYFLDAQKHLVTYVADEASMSRSRSIMQDHLSRHSLGIGARDAVAGVLIRKAAYSFLQLSAWRDSVYLHLLGTGDVLFDDLDEAINRVTIGIDRSRFESARAALLPRLQSLAIPLDAVHFEPIGHIVARVSYPFDLNSPMDTLGAGYRISSPVGGCSLGIVGDSANVRVFVTASHCSTWVYRSDNTQFTDQGGRVIGFENADPAPNSPYCTWQGVEYHCYDGRGSDADLVRVSAGIPSARGRIARLQNRVSGGVGTLAIDQSRPWIYVTSTEHGHPVGSTVDKVGATSGWTFGTIQNSCTDEIVNGPGQNADYAVRCSIKTSTYSLGGDSGSPFFIWDGQDVAQFMGILWGGESGNANVTYYAGYRALENDLGILDAGILKVTSDLTLTPLSLSSQWDPPSMILSWSGGRGIGTYGTTYTLSRTDYYIQYDREWGWPYWVQGWSGQLYTSPYAESYTDTSPWGTSETACPVDPYSGAGGYSVYTISATSMGMTTSTSICAAM